MVTLIILTLFYIILIAFELVPIYKDRDKKLFWTYTLSIISTYILNVLIILGIKIPCPTDPIKKIIVRIFNLEI